MIYYKFVCVNIHNFNHNRLLVIVVCDFRLIFFKILSTAVYITQSYVGPPPMAIAMQSNPKLCYDRRSIGQSVLVSSTNLIPKTGFLLLSDSCGFLDVGRFLWRDDGSVVYSCRWSSPAELFSGSSPTEFMTIFYSLRFETPPAWRAKSPCLYPAGTRWPSYPPTHSVQSSSPATTRRATVEIFETASTRARYAVIPPAEYSFTQNIVTKLS
jgi:hypothetical protein